LSEDDRPVPRLTIGVPVYNGERYLRDTLDALLSQTFEDFELIISDNASTDATEEIGRAYADKDARVRYVRRERNLGAAGNFNALVGLSRSEYFKWAAHDDLVAPTFLERCIEALDADAGVILAYTRGRRIDDRGVLQGHYDKWDNRLRITDPAPHVRFHDAIKIPHRCFAVFGVHRRDVLARTPLIDRHVGSDRTLLSELALRGRWVQVPEYLFDLREHAGNSMNANVTERSRMAWFDPDRVMRIGFPVWRELAELVKTVHRVELPPVEKARCYSQLGPWLFGPNWYRQKWVFLLKDLVTGGALAVRKATTRLPGRVAGR
jgi:glycosyltransferase involved in cell wall biosynthesis